MNKWDSRFIKLAEEVSIWSKVEHSQQGCVAVSPNKRQFTVGYNGLPKNYPEEGNFIDLGDTVHAEINCIVNATLILDDWVLYVTKTPCLDCAKAIANSGIARVWCPRPEGSWEDNQKRAMKLLTTCEIEVIYYGN